MQTIERQIVPFAEFLQPTVRRLIIHFLAVPFGEQLVRFDPFTAEFQHFAVLLLFEITQQFHDPKWESDRALGTLRFSRIGTLWSEAFH